MPLSQTPFFIVGMGRSGSTYLYHLLRDHPAIALSEEARILDILYLLYRTASLESGVKIPSDIRGVDCIQGVMDHPANALFRGILLEHAPRMIADFYAAMFPDKRFTHFGDKLPSIAAALEFKAIDPATRYLVLVRDPRDVAASVRAVGWPHSLERTCTLWREIYARASGLPDAHTLRYEELVRNPDQVVAAALDHLGLEMDESCRAAIRGNRSFAARGTSASPAASIERWKRELAAEEARAVEELCAAGMAVFGYH